MPKATITTKTIFEDTAATFMARIKGDDATYPVAGDFNDSDNRISWKVFLAGSEVGSGFLSNAQIAAAVFGSVFQTNARWTADAVGYNFIYLLPASNFATGDGVYDVEFKFEPTDQEPFFLVYRLTVIAIQTS